MNTYLRSQGRSTLVLLISLLAKSTHNQIYALKKDKFRVTISTQIKRTVCVKKIFFSTTLFSFTRRMLFLKSFESVD